MRLILHVSLVLLLVMPSLMFAASQSAQAPALSPARITGRVLRADGQPLPKANVDLISADKPTEAVSVRTNSQGVFEFAQIAPGRYRLSARRTGYVTQFYGQARGGPAMVLTVQPGQKLEGIDIRLERAGVISGTVVDEDFEPVEGIQVRVERQQFSRGGRRQIVPYRGAVTDDLGNFRLPGLAPGSYVVRAGGRGSGVSFDTTPGKTGYGAAYYRDASSPEDALAIQVTSGNEVSGIQIPVRSTPMFQISGVVVDAREVWGQRRISVGLASSSGWATTTLDPGKSDFTLPGLLPGEYTVMSIVTDEGGVRRGYQKVTLTNADARIALEVGRTAKLRVEAQLDEPGAEFSFEGISVVLRTESDDAVQPREQLPRDGRATLQDVPAGSYTVELSGRDTEVYLKSVRCEAEEFATKPLRLEPERDTSCTLKLARDVALVAGGVTYDTPESLEGSLVVLIPVEPDRRKNPRHTSTALIDAGNQFEARGVVPGDYFLFAVPRVDGSPYYDPEFPERNREQATRLTVKPSETHVVQLKWFRPR